MDAASLPFQSHSPCDVQSRDRELGEAIADAGREARAAAVLGALECDGVIRAFHANLDFERIDGVVQQFENAALPSWPHHANNRERIPQVELDFAVWD